MSRPIGMRTGPRSTLNDLPCRVWALRSNIASQIHIAGRICTSVSRQLDTSSLRPVNSITNALIANASGANTRRERLSRRIASSTLASSFSSIARTSARTRAENEAGWRSSGALAGGFGAAGSAAPLPVTELSTGIAAYLRLEITASRDHQRERDKRTERTQPVEPDSVANVLGIAHEADRDRHGQEQGGAPDDRPLVMTVVATRIGSLDRVEDTCRPRRRNRAAFCGRADARASHTPRPSRS